MPNIAHYFSQHLSTPSKVMHRQFIADAWCDVSVGELAAQVGRWQGAFRSLSLAPGERVALCLRNGVDWIAPDLAALGLGLVIVPLYVDDNAENVAWCAGNAEARVLIVESTRMAGALAKCGIALPPIYVSHPDDGADTPPSVEALLRGREAGQPEFRDLEPDTLATICYTSGTSGRPKGVMLSHGNIIANVESCRALNMAREDDVFLSILPLSHMFERTGGYYLPLAIGAKVVYSRGVAQIADDLAAQKPTAMFAVPRVFEKFQARVEQSLAESPLKRGLFEQCVERGWRIAQGQAHDAGPRALRRCCAGWWPRRCSRAWADACV